MRSDSDHILDYALSQQVLALIIVAFFSIALYYLIRYDDSEQAAPFVVPLPEQSKPGWRGVILEHPSLKVCRLESHAYQS